MRLSKMIGRTVREIPAEAETEGHRLLIRAGIAHRVASGIYVYGHLGWRSVQKIMQILREEMDGVDGQEINMPVTAPADLWKETGRWSAVGSELARWKDRWGRDMVLAMTHEETLTDYLRSEVYSYKQLPFMLYQIQTKFRDEPRPRAGLIRTREFYMKDGYSCHLTEECMDTYYERMADAYYRVFNRAGLDVVSVSSDNGMFGGKESHEYMYLTPVGEDKLFFCDSCRYAANYEVTERQPVNQDNTPPATLQEVATPERLDIPGQAAFLGVTPKEFLKTLAYITRGHLVLVVIRGDLMVNEVKLSRILGDDAIRLATPEELQAGGFVEGFLSPLGRSERLIVDPSVTRSPNLVAGANKEGYHVMNSNFGRDYTSAEVYDIVAVVAGDPCPLCGAPLRDARGIEVGNIFKLGTRYSVNMNALVQNENGEQQPMIMGCYGIGVGRILSTVLEAYNDKDGIIWPVTVAPYLVHLTTLGVEEEVIACAEQLYQEWTKAGLEVLYDDRDLRPGVKLNDADLLGMPLRVVVSRRSLATQSLELKERGLSAAESLPLAGSQAVLYQRLEELRRQIYLKYPYLSHLS
ncbi:MAG: proline--tRNA ligase [Symbiobacteriaceae bacterium]|nr:proline--tRNA ligase [Symbiobacteriaceae bacterium]